MTDYPAMIAEVNRMEPVPRRIRATLGNRVVLDTVRAMYLWESPKYPQYYIPVTDIDPAAVVDESRVQRLSRGTARRIGLRAGDISRPDAGRVYTEDSLAGLQDMARLEWDKLDAWFEEDEQVFVHPRNPYTRVDALRSTRHIRVELDGVALAETRSAVLVFETGLPTRFYINPTEVDFTVLRPTPTVTACPYKGRTTGYWSAHINGAVYDDLAWTYAFPTGSLLPVAGLVSFYNEQVDIHVDGQLQERPVTHLRAAR